ncbi:hypothetical protein HYFRA_00008913 [Hymenoscyphus fraxineus]|uniref:Uncharacterized protein n=1 Tax=Hymenoscyphus fraxineus TaxID=746836 RepID=A0A9N9PMS2_9HELO|nr:hypothetical protein HYFRA_00008913 [Hymenoscyphus fraxineus]
MSAVDVMCWAKDLGIFGNLRERRDSAKWSWKVWHHSPWDADDQWQVFLILQVKCFRLNDMPVSPVRKNFSHMFNTTHRYPGYLKLQSCFKRLPRHRPWAHKASHMQPWKGRCFLTQRIDRIGHAINCNCYRRGLLVEAMMLMMVKLQR